VKTGEDNVTIVRPQKKKIWYGIFAWCHGDIFFVDTKQTQHLSPNAPLLPSADDH